MTTARLDHDTVVRIAGAIADHEGIDAITLSLIAERAGVTQPALYRHVNGLDGVLRGLGLLARTELAAAIAEACIGVTRRAAVRAAAHAWRDYGRRHPGRYRSTDRTPVAGDAELEAAVERVLDVLARSLSGFALDDEETAHGARLLRSALHGFVAFELGDGHPLDPPVDATFERLIDVLCDGFEATVTRSRPA